MPATIRDVARLAGCSIKTVSRVINDEPYVTEGTRAKVIAAIRAVGYAPNISARRLAQNKSYMICLLSHPGFFQPGSDLLMRVMDIGFVENYDILIQPYFPLHSNSRRKLVNLIYEHRIDGFITLPPLDADEFVADMLTTYKVPQVQISPFQRNTAIPYVAGEDQLGAQRMTEYLISLGHQRIAFISGPNNIRASNDRLLGYQYALQRNGIPFNPDLVRDSEWTFADGYSVAKIFIDLPERPDAIFAGNDEAAFGAVFAAQERNIRIPGQLSICGYDDLGQSRTIWPGLTTVHHPFDEIMEQATRLLIALLKGNPPRDIQFLLIPHLVVRGSTGPPDSSPDF